MLEQINMSQGILTREVIRDDRGLLGLLEQEIEYHADLRRLSEPTVETPGRFVDVVSGEEEMEWSE